MGDEVTVVADVVRLTDEEARSWDILVEEGHKLRDPIVERRKEELARRIEKAERDGNENALCILRRQRDRSSADSMVEIPSSVKRWVVLRFSGLSFRKAVEASGATWADVQEAKARSEEFRCAYAAQEESSRQLMKAKAASVVEQSQDEGAKVSLAQTQVSMKILSSLDAEHFGEGHVRRISEVDDGDGARAISGGGFVINLVADAAKVAEAVPASAPKRALVYSDV